MDWKIAIDEVLEYREITQENLSKKINVSKSYICKLRSGDKNSPSFDIGLAIIKLHPNKEELLK